MQRVQYPARMKKFLVVLLLPLTASAFGSFGHRAIAQIAQSKLTPAARAQIDALLQVAPRSSLAEMSVWPDEIRNDPIHPRPETAPWHYLNFPPGKCRAKISNVCPKGDCLPVKLSEQLQVLSDKTKPMPLRAEALGFVVHFYGDIHQPLHLGFARDKGGNDFQLSLPEGTVPPPAPDNKAAIEAARWGANLHSYWDTLLFRSNKIPEADYTLHIAALPVSARTSAKFDVASMTRESCERVQALGFYPRSHKLSAEDIAKSRPLAEAQLALAAARLANALNAALK
jgi:nuclease S1